MAPASILVLCTRRIGDVLLTTPLIRSLRRAWPQARLDVLTLTGSAAALEGNPDIDRVIALPERAPLLQSLTAVGAPRRYDLAVSTLYNDRPHLLAWWSASRRANVVPTRGEPGAVWKRLAASCSVVLEPVHTVLQYLKLADALGVARCFDVVPPRPSSEAALDALLGAGWRGRAYAVVHPMALYEYKAWTLDGWRRLVAWLLAHGLEVVVTGGSAERERAFVDAVTRDLGRGVRNAAGRLKLAELSPLLAQARVFVGPDTSVSHLAAASGVGSVVLFGPSNPVVWGPWPQGHDGADPGPWRFQAPLQQRGNVWLLQGLAPCVPCLLEGCERRLESRSACLDTLPLSRVTNAVAQALAARPPRQPPGNS